jgi:sugar transferase (PEP-CTERM/EpsH1 system associated)
MRILFLTSRFPYPLEKGDKLRAFYHIVELSKKHEIILAAVSDKQVTEEDLDALKPFCKKILVHNLSKARLIGNLSKALFNGKPFQVEYFFAEEFKDRINKVIEEDKPHAIFCQLVRMAEYVRDIKHIPKTLDYQDAFSKGLERLAQSTSIFKKIPVRMEWKRMLRYERHIFDSFEHKIIISEQDRKLIPHPDHDEISIVPNGVDLSFYVPQESKKTYDLIFAGNMNYPPNIESALYIAQKIMPLLQKKKPDVRLVIAGATPSNEILKLESESIHVTGWVDDIREPFAESRIHLAPMLISIGLQNKILQAMSMKIPSIVSTLANNAIHAPTDDCLLIADTPEEYAEKIITLLNDKQLYDKLSENGYQFVHQNFDWAGMTAPLEKLLFT